jgi:short-subunit dehydrogenase
VGRNQEEASRIQSEFETLNPTSEIKFIQSDISLLKNVDKACAEIEAQESSINLLFMSPGYLTLGGRDGRLLYAGNSRHSSEMSITSTFLFIPLLQSSFETLVTNLPQQKPQRAWTRSLT